MGVAAFIFLGGNILVWAMCRAAARREEPFTTPVAFDQPTPSSVPQPARRVDTVSA